MLSTVETNKVWELIKPIKTGMLASWNGEFLHARPMRHVNDDFDGTLLFFTKCDSGKVKEAKKFDDVCVTYADADDSSYVSLSGVAELTQDKALIDEHWNMFVKAWFPEGKEDPNLAIMKVQVYCAEYWDSTSSSMVQLFKIAKANVTGEIPDMGEHDKLG